MPSALRPAPRALAMASLSLAMHAAFLPIWIHLPRPALLGSDVAPPVLQVSLQSPTRSGAPSLRLDPFDAALPAALTNAVGDRATSAAPQFASPAQSTQSTQSAQPAQLAQPTQLAQAAQAQNTPGLPLASSEWAYLPASQLDQRPRPQAEIVLPFPEGETLARGARVSAVLVLYVSEEGAVDRIEFGQSELPPAFARVALESFARVRMRPGIKNGRARRAMMKIEVEFEAPVSRQEAAGAVLESSRSWHADPREESLQ